MDCGHVVIGEMSFIKDSNSRKLLENVLSFREPKTINFVKICESIINDVKLILGSWSEKGKNQYR